jgi:hypothetical protein
MTTPLPSRWLGIVILVGIVIYAAFLLVVVKGV